MDSRHTATPVQLATGIEVEVRTHYLDTWARGFEVASMTGGHAQLRRRSDGVILPVTFPIERLRPRDSHNAGP
jgi:hypothetical protein